MATQQFLIKEDKFTVTGADGISLELSAVRVTVEQDGGSVNAWLDMRPDMEGDKDGKNGKPIRYADQKNQFKAYPEYADALSIHFGEYGLKITMETPQFAEIATAIVGRSINAVA